MLVKNPHYAPAFAAKMPAADFDALVVKVDDYLKANKDKAVIEHAALRAVDVALADDLLFNLVREHLQLNG